MRLGRANARAVATRRLHLHGRCYPLVSRCTLIERWRRVSARRAREKIGAWLAFGSASNIEAGVKPTTPTTQLTVKTLLNHVQHFVGFVYRRVVLCGESGGVFFTKNRRFENHLTIS